MLQEWTDLKQVQLGVYLMCVVDVSVREQICIQFVHTTKSWWKNINSSSAEASLLKISYI